MPSWLAAGQQAIEIREHRLAHQIGVDLGDAVHRMAADERQMRHAHIGIASFLDNRHLHEPLVVSRPAGRHLFQEAVVYLMDDLEDTWQHAAEQPHRPALQCDDERVLNRFLGDVDVAEVRHDLEGGDVGQLFAFGGLDPRNKFAHSVYHFFNNGGQQALVIRLAADDAGFATVTVGAVLQVTARGEARFRIRSRRVQADGLVRRVPHPTDRRATLVEITDGGRAALEDATKAVTDVDLQIETAIKTVEGTARSMGLEVTG